MSAETAANRYTCRDCRKTYRSFRSEPEWRVSHVADVCTASGERKASAAPRPAAQRQPVKAGAPTAAVQRRAATAVEAKARPVAQPSPPAPAVPEAPAADADTLPWWGSLANAAAVFIGSLILLGATLDAYGTLSDQTGGPAMLRIILAVVVCGSCLVGVAGLVRSAVPALQRPDRR